MHQDKAALRKDLADPLARLQQAAKKIAQTQKECKLPVDEQEYLESFKPYLMDVVHAWCKVCPHPGVRWGPLQALAAWCAQAGSEVVCTP